jgi:DNA-binding winged helix-turn-helix (wHTH) protein
MDAIVRSVLAFDRFELDVGLSRLRVGGQAIDLRPKAFAVLRLLAENAGRLVPKTTLYETVWPGVAVGDDSLSQCIYELREILGDKDHRLIRTVSRRGYVLDAAPKAQFAEARSVAPVQTPATSVPESRPLPSWVDRVSRRTTIMGSLGCLILGAILMQVLAPQRAQTYDVPLHFKPASLAPSALNRFFTDGDAKRVSDIAETKHLPLPKVEFDTPDDDVSAAMRRFVGVWVSSKGFVNTNRQFMFILTHVEKEGLTGGFTVRGPPAPNSRVQNPAEAVPFTAQIKDGLLTYKNPRGAYEVSFVEGGKLIFKQTYVTGDVTMVALEPVWTLTDAEHRNAP